MKKSVLIICLIFGSLKFYAQVESVEKVGFTVNDMNKSIQFFTKILGFSVISDETKSGENYENLTSVFGLNIRVVNLKLGDEILELTDYLTSGGRSIPETQKSNDIFFQHIAIVVSDMDKAFQILSSNHIEFVSTKPQTLPASIPEAAGIKAFYFHDPDNHNLELIFFPKGKGQEKWQKSNGKIFLGIDHTAIGIENTDSSHIQYANVLGFNRKGDSWNKGIEQAHLNNVENASLHITGYRAFNGIGVEFLEYLTPKGGIPFPNDTKSNDRWHWQTTLIVKDIEDLVKELTKKNFKFISKKVSFFNEKNNKHIAILVRDRDGHALLLKQYL